VEDILRWNNNQTRWEASIGGRTAWQPLASISPAEIASGVYVGHFDGSRGAQLLILSAAEGSSLAEFAPALRRTKIFSRATGGNFVPYGKYAY
jgi:hypothetical protein